MTFKTRLAPTPSGFLHLGNAFNFLLTEHLAQQKDASIRLRIDDLDAARVRPEYLQDIIETLDWLGIRWTEGPHSVAEQEEHFSQQLRLAAYEALIQQLADTDLVFACNCSRAAWMAQSTDGQYPGTCLHKNLPLDSPNAALRIRTPEGSVVSFRDGILGAVSVDLFERNRHFIIRRRDGIPAYHIASLADDVAYRCNLIVRGQDLADSTAAQLYLSGLPGSTTFQEAEFYHHPLIADTGGGKLSKSAGSASLKQLRAEGLPASALRQQFVEWSAGFYAGLQ